MNVFRLLYGLEMTQKRFQKGHGSFHGLGDEENDVERATTDLKERGMKPQT